MSSKKKVITIVVTTAALSLGSFGIASANNSKNSFKVKSTNFTHLAAAFGNPSHLDVDGQNGVLASVLAGLVTKGTLTQAQVDAINTAISAAHTANQTQGDARRAAHENLIATTIGITVASLETRLSAGDSLATIAGAKTSALITALVAEVNAEIDAAVAAGKITAAQATTFKANATAQVTAMVNGTREMGREMGHNGEGHGPGTGREMGHNGEGHGPGMGFLGGGMTVSPRS